MTVEAKLFKSPDNGPLDIRHLTDAEKLSIKEIVIAAGLVEVLRLLSTLAQNSIEDLEVASHCAGSIRAVAQTVRMASVKQCIEECIEELPEIPF